MSIEIHHDSVLGSRVEYNTDDLLPEEEIKKIELHNEVLEIRRNIPSVNGI